MPATRDRGYILYPGKLTQVETFRVGCIGAIDANEMRNVVSAVAATLKDMGIPAIAPVESRRVRKPRGREQGAVATQKAIG